MSPIWGMLLLFSLQFAFAPIKIAQTKERTFGNRRHPFLPDFPLHESMPSVTAFPISIPLFLMLMFLLFFSTLSLLRPRGDCIFGIHETGMVSWWKEWIPFSGHFTQVLNISDSDYIQSDIYAMLLLYPIPTTCDHRYFTLKRWTESRARRAWTMLTLWHLFNWVANTQYTKSWTQAHRLQ